MRADAEAPIPNVTPPLYDLSAEQIELRDQAAKYFMATLHPLNKRMDDEEWWPAEAFQALGEMGYLGQTIPEDYGGTGLDYLTAGLLNEQMAMANGAMALSVVAHDNLCANNIYRNGSEAQRRKYLPALCSGESVGALGMTEPGAGSDALGSMATTAVREGDDYVLNGRKMFITNGPVADTLLIYAKTDKSKGTRGISAFIVEKGFPGFGVAQKLDKMGYRGSTTAELVFDDCRVPAENLVGGEHRGVAVMMSGLDLERAMVGPLCIGSAQRGLDLAIEHAKTREQFGQPIASFQMIQSKLAEMYIRLESARTFVYRALAACNHMASDEGGRGGIHKLTAAALFEASDTVKFVHDEAVQIHGGMGYMRETEINRLYREAKVMEIGAGTQEVRKIIIAEELLR